MLTELRFEVLTAVKCRSRFSVRRYMDSLSFLTLKVMYVQGDSISDVQILVVSFTSVRIKMGPQLHSSQVRTCYMLQFDEQSTCLLAVVERR